ncbi:hypothetical protein F4810DRAFT_311868 [Camillea tinctor]|nr:hypothetical protein F4810DRAFT_311868 [Camillea tinctor]
MADHPYSYGQFPAQQPHPHFAHQPSPANLQPSYFGTPQMGGVVANNYATANNSYEYNASRIPGLGLGGSSIPPASRPENTTPWHFPLPTTQPNVPPQPKPPAAMNNNYQQPIQGNLPPRVRDAPASSQQLAGGALEEGELSEGEFEDLYEPKDSTVNAAPTSNPATRPSGIPENRPSSVGDADGSSIYDAASPQGEAAVNSTSVSLPAADQDYSPDEDWEPTYPERERSGSYSPYLSPREVQRKASVSKVMPRDNKFPDFQQGIPSIDIATAPVQQLSRPSTLNNEAAAAPNTHSLVPPNKESSSAPPFRSVSEAKKKAQEAILGLWPLKVRYQDYIEEGLDATVIKKLFTDLGLDTSVSKPPGSSQKTISPDASAASKPTTISPKGTSELKQTAIQPQIAPQIPASSTPSAPEVVLPDRTQASTADKKNEEVKTPAKTAAEERKDKIARKLAAKAQKTTTAAQPAAPAAPTTTTTTSTNTRTPISITSAPESKPMVASPAKPKGKTRAENNAILQQKLAALKKLQEKTAANKNLATPKDVPASISPGAGVSSAATPTPERKSGADLPSKSPPAVSVSSESDNRPGSTDIQGTSKDGSIPGLTLSSQASQGPIRTLKRPVASDFDNYTPREVPLKRTRTQETLIIDVSDDEDVEMEIGSPVDEPSTPTELVNASARKTPLSAFAPLSDTPNWRQHSSPVSNSVSTPPVDGAKLDLLRKKIEETKRRIAEAEAKKAKKVVTTESPQPQSPQITENTNLTKATEAKPRPSPSAGRRDRIVSFELPRLEASLKEKQDMIKQLFAQATQLELEVQASLDEKQKLTSEVERLSAAPEERPTISNSQSPPASPTAIGESEVSRLPLEPPREPENQPPTHDQPQPRPDPSEDQNTTSHNDVISPKTVSPEESSNLDIDMASSDSSSDSGNIITDSSTSQNASHMNIEPQPEIHPVNTSLVPNEAEAPSGGEATALDTMNDAMDIQPEESEEDSSEADISMQTSAADLSESDDDSYEPSPAQISNPHDPQAQDAPNGEAIDEIPDEPNPTHVTSGPTIAEPKKTHGEVKECSSPEHPLLTPSQDDRNTNDSLEDLLSYHSPLGYFRAYRFHPKYFDEVQGGLKSMTYSSRIDPMRPLCPDVLAGEQCPRGNACEFQHFENMVLPDAEIITQLGSADMFTGETKSRFIEGLKKVLNDLKANKVRDFDRITRAIVKHRQDFLNDKTKVLPLDAGTS